MHNIYIAMLTKCMCVNISRGGNITNDQVGEYWVEVGYIKFKDYVSRTEH